MRPRIITSLVMLALSFFSEIPVSTGFRPRHEIVDTTSYNTPDATILEQLHQASLANLDQYMQSKTDYAGQRGPKCSIHKASVRREWGTLSPSDRKAYTDAVLCLTKKPSLSDPILVPGARSRYDDFVGVHINQTQAVHFTSKFLSWHRYFIWKFEQALREECGYQGYLPYWNWGKYANDPESSPVFDGSPYSMSGNGVYVPNRKGFLLPGGVIYIPPQNGGGCITSGPFKDMVVNLGPVIPAIQGATLNPRSDGLGYNPRCLKRDIGNYCSKRWTKTSDIISLIVKHNDVGTFQNVMQGNLSDPNGLGVHGGAHLTASGDPGGDLYASAGDPVFYLLHGMIDYCWWVWQNLDPKDRTYTIAGTLTFNNIPPSRDGTLDDKANFGVVDPNEITLRELMSTVDGPFCYVYE